MSKEKKAYYDSFYDQLDQFNGLSHHALLEQQPVRQLFYWAATTYPREDWKDLQQQAYVHFLEARQIKPPEKYKFSCYLAVVVRHIVRKAFRYRHRKKRYMKTSNFRVNEAGKFIEPRGTPAPILFSHDEITQIRATLWMRAKNDGHRDGLMAALDGLLESESARETANRTGVTSRTIFNSRSSIRALLTDSLKKEQRN